MANDVASVSQAEKDPAKHAFAINQIAERVRGLLADGSVTTAKIADDAVTNVKLANMAQATIKGRAVGAGTGDPIDLTGDQAIAVMTGGNADSLTGATNRWGILPYVGSDG